MLYPARTEVSRRRDTGIFDMQRFPRRSTARRMAPALALTTVVGLGGGVTTPAFAQSAADQWSSAIREQQEAIASNRSQRARCGASGDPRCAALADRGRLMEENLGRLERHHARLVGAPPPPRTGAVTSPSRSTARFDRSEAPPGVNVTSAPAAPAPQRSFFSMLFGGGGTEAPRSGVRIDGEPVESETPLAGAPGDGFGAYSGNYRTLCVRTCDGFFFPVSFNASRSRLKTDANVCKALCPQAETRLYYHDANGQEAENAVAADDGSPIAQMTNAFLYRSKRVADCTCGTPDPRTLPVQAGGLAGSRAAMFSASGEVPLPRVRPSPDQDPATQAVQLGGLSLDPVAPLSPMNEETAAKVASVSEANREPPKVRIVGPTWLADR